MLMTERFARFAAELHQAPLAPHVAQGAQRAVTDWFASLYPGSGMPAVQVLEHVDVRIAELVVGADRIVVGKTDEHLAIAGIGKLHRVRDPRRGVLLGIAEDLPLAGDRRPDERH